MGDHYHLRSNKGR